jgi:hypothetical protein
LLEWRLSDPQEKSDVLVSQVHFRLFQREDKIRLLQGIKDKFELRFVLPLLAIIK